VFAFLTEVLSVTSVRGPCFNLRVMEGGDIEGGERQWKVDRQKRPEENRQSIERAVDRYSGSRNVEYLA